MLLNPQTRMANILTDNRISDDVEVAIEFQIPLTSKRVDFMIAGNNGISDNVVIVELKQWDKCTEVGEMDGIYKVNTYTGGGLRDVNHPSYQAMSYANGGEIFVFFQNWLDGNPSVVILKFMLDILFVLIVPLKFMQLANIRWQLETFPPSVPDNNILSGITYNFLQSANMYSHETLFLIFLNKFGGTILNPVFLNIYEQVVTLDGRLKVSFNVYVLPNF